MAIVEKKPSRKYTVGAQYIAFDSSATAGEYSGKFEAEVTKLPTVVSIEVKDESDSYNDFASGQIYDAGTQTAYEEISTENIAFQKVLVEKMRGSKVDENGVIVGGGNGARPYFAYGIVVKSKDNSLDLKWYPKCKLAENTDKSETSEDSDKVQSDTLTIRAYGFDDEDNKYVEAEAVEGITEDKFFAAPLLSAADVLALKTGA